MRHLLFKNLECGGKSEIMAMDADNVLLPLCLPVAHLHEQSVLLSEFLL